MAHESAQSLMQADDPSYWEKHSMGLPTRAIDRNGKAITIGAYTITVNQGPHGHTKSDLWIYIEQANLVVLGDAMVQGYYPFFDDVEGEGEGEGEGKGSGGSSLETTSLHLRTLAATYPEARFVPGHGKVAQAKDVIGFADYIDSMQIAVAKGIARKLSAEEAWATYDAKPWRRRVLPSFHHGTIKWATAKSGFISAYRMAQSREAGRMRSVAE